MSYSYNDNQDKKKLLVINELPEVDSPDQQLVQSKRPLLKKQSIQEIEMTDPRSKTPSQKLQEDEYAHIQTKHTQLIGDLASEDKTIVCTLNWKEKIRKQYNTQKYLKFRAPYQLNRKILLFSEFKHKYVSLMPIIDPQSSFLTYWKIPIMIITILFFVEVPLIIFFADDFYYTFHTPLYVTFRMIIILMFLTDIFIEFHVAFYNHGALVKNRRRVAMNYLTGMFFFDMVPLLIIMITTFSYTVSQIYYIYLIFLLKMYPVYEIDQRFQDKLQVYPKWKSSYMIGRMVIEIVYLTHFFGCVFFGTAMYMLNYHNNPAEGEHINSWLTFSEGNFGTILYYGWTKRYILSTYWAFATLTTVAYGDITPMNEFEIVVSEIAMIAAVFLVAFNVTNIQQTFVEYFEETRKYHKEIVAITKFMRSKEVSNETEKEIRNFLEHYFKEKRNRDHYIEEQVFMKLAPQLKSRLMYEAYQKFLTSVPWICANFSDDFIKELSQCVAEVDYSKKENIFLDYNNDNTDDNSLYFVQIGEIELFMDVPETFRQEVVIAHLKPGAHFGDYAFVTGLERKASARSKKYTQVVQVTRSNFLEKIQQFPLDHQRFCFLRDEVIFNQAYNELGIECFTCSSTDHMSLDCPLTHLQIGKEVIKRMRQQVFQRKMSRILQSPYQPRDSTFVREQQTRSRVFYKIKIKQELSEQYQDILVDKAKFEAFHSDNKVIIESFQVDKIENYINYYPDFNFDYLVTQRRQGRPANTLVFANQARLRNVSGIYRKSEIII